MNKRFSALFLALCLLFSLALPVSANETADVTIGSAQDFLIFAQSCRLDTYSEGLTVSLNADIDLTGESFDGIPFFAGTFLGNGHTVSGVSIRSEGSSIGVFRYLTSSASVLNLTVKGEIIPKGTRTTVGGIVGENAGTLRGCSFFGTVSGLEKVGGIAGVNTVTGLIESCDANGVVSGKHNAGGITGINNGVIRDSWNTSAVNNTAEENTVNIGDITVDSITGSEAANTVTDIGGIAGANSGVIRSCDNRGAVGYPHMGYNVGGIAGSQSGYITACENSGVICGRKEVGGIVGQIEPYTVLSFSADTLQILNGQLSTLDSMMNSTQQELQNGTNNVKTQVGAIRDHVKNAQDALGSLEPDFNFEDDETYLDRVLAAQSTLSSSMSGVQQSAGNIRSDITGTVNSLTTRVEAMLGQVETIGNTLKNPTANLGGSFTDISNADTSADKTGKVEACKNTGSVQADRNGGGIAGAIAIENELNHEDDFEVTGNTTLHFEGELRAVLTDCENSASVSVMKQNGGGIIGLQSLGLVRHCTSSGAVEAIDADHVGGIAGKSTSWLTACYARCSINGKTFVGGIAGSGVNVSFCRAMTQISGVEKSGGILGASDSLENITDNVYLSVGGDLGGIDGISYDKRAQTLGKNEFLALDNLPDMFTSVFVTFRYEDGSEVTVGMEPGAPLLPSAVPTIPAKAGHIASWKDLDTFDTSAIWFDTAFDAQYVAHDAVIRSLLLRKGTVHPILLVQGDFPLGDSVTLREYKGDTLSDIEDVIEAWTYTLPAEGTASKLRFCIPQEYQDKALLAFVLDESGEWVKAETAVNGSYLVFEIANGETTFCIAKAPFDPLPYILIGAGALLFLLLVLIIALVHRAKKKKAQQA